MEFKSKIQGKVLSGQTREVVANVIEYMRREAEEMKPLRTHMLSINFLNFHMMHNNYCLRLILYVYSS